MALLGEDKCGDRNDEMPVGILLWSLQIDVRSHNMQRVLPRCGISSATTVHPFTNRPVNVRPSTNAV